MNLKFSLNAASYLSIFNKMLYALLHIRLFGKFTCFVKIQFYLKMIIFVESSFWEMEIFYEMSVFNTKDFVKGSMMNMFVKDPVIRKKVVKGPVLWQILCEVIFCNRRRHCCCECKNRLPFPIVPLFAIKHWIIWNFFTRRCIKHPTPTKPHFDAFSLQEIALKFLR